MKKNYLMMMAMLLFAAISFTGCSGDDDKDVTTDEDFETLLVGTWELIHSTGYEIVNGKTYSWDEDDDGYCTFYGNGTGKNLDGT